MNKPGQRIIDRLSALGLSQAELARRVGVTQPSINHLIKRGTGGSSHLHKIARILETTPEYLTGETDDPLPAGAAEFRPGFNHVPEAPKPVATLDEDGDTVEIQELDLAYGMGGGTYLDMPVKADKRKFSRSWLRIFTDAPPSRIFVARGMGDSMMPTILDADIVLIDTSELAPRMADKIWALNYSGMGMIKRLRPTPDGGWSIMSDNPSVSDITAYDGEMSIVGRVVAIVRKV